MSDLPAVTTRRRDATRLRLLDAAAQVFAEVGLEAASVEAICDRAGFTRGAFYSNFESKDQLFLQLAGRAAEERVAAVKDRVHTLGGDTSTNPANAFSIIEEVLDISADDRLSVLLMSEIRIHALRDPQLAAAYLQQEEEMLDGVAQIIGDIGRARGMTFRVPANEAARLMITVWESASVRAVMSGLSHEEMVRRTGEELALIAQLIIEPSVG